MNTSVIRWLWLDLVPALAIVVGAHLIGRLAQWIFTTYRSALDRQVRAVVEQGGVASDSSKRQRALVQAIGWAVQALIYTVATILTLKALGLPLTSLVAPATVIGVALGFGAQQLVGDMLAGFFLFAERQFGIGDLIRLGTPGQTTGISGTVEELTLRVTKLRSQQGELIVVPNSALRQVTNLSRDWSRVVLDLPVSVEEDLGSVIETIGEVAASMASEPLWHDLIVGDPVVAGVETIEVGYVQLRILVRTLPGRQFEVGRELRLRMVTKLREIGVSTPTVAVAP